MHLSLNRAERGRWLTDARTVTIRFCACLAVYVFSYSDQPPSRLSVVVVLLLLRSEMMRN